MSQSNENTQKLFRPALVLVLVLVSIFSLSAFLALSAFAPDLRDKSNGGGHAWSRSAIGYAGFARILEETGQSVQRFRGQPHSLYTGAFLQIITPTSNHSAKEILKASTGPTLIVLPKWRVSRARQNPKWVVGYGLSDHQRIAKLVGDLLKTKREDKVFYSTAKIERVRGIETKPVLEKIKPGKKPKLDTDTEQSSKKTKTRMSAAERIAQRAKERLKRNNAVLEPVATWQTANIFGGVSFDFSNITSLQTMRDVEASALIWSRDNVILAKVPGREIYILSDPDVMNTAGIKHISNLRAGIQIVQGLKGANTPIWFDLSLHGFTKNINLIKTMLMPPFLAATLCAMAAAGLMVWAGWGRFGPIVAPVRVHLLGKQALVDNSAALIRLADQQSAMVPGYAQISHNLAAKAIGAPQDFSQAQVHQLLAKIGKNINIKTDIDVLFAQANKDKYTPQELLDITSKLYKWRGEISGEHRKR